VASQIVNGEEWIRTRLAFLRSRLDTELTDDERTAVQAEIERLMEASAVSCHGLPVGWVRRWRARRRPSRFSGTGRT
jgi:hypothetical protein